MAFKMKGYSPFTQCFPGQNCKPGGRRSNKLRQKWNKLKANISDAFEKRNIPNSRPSPWEGFDPKNPGMEYRITNKGDTIWKEPEFWVSPGPNKKSK